MGWMVRESNPGGGEIFRTCPDRLWGSPSHLYNGYRVFPGVKERQGRDANPSPLSSGGHERVELYIYSPYGPYSLYRASVPVQECTLSMLLRLSFLTVYLFIFIFIFFLFIFYFLLWRCDPTRVMSSSFLRFLDHTQRRTTVGRTSLDEWSARRKDLYLTTHNIHNRQISMPR
jgi:hypothetical protein